MALKPFNSVGGFSVGESFVTIIDSNGNVTSTRLAANGNVQFTGANVSLGAVANLQITGGSNGQVLTSNGSGGLSFTTLSPNSIFNGNSNVSVAANGNVTVSVAGNANILTVTGTGANVSGTLNATGNATFANVSGGNLVAANFVQGTLTTASQPFITTVGTLGNLAVSNTANVGNLRTDNLLYANGTPWDFNDPGGSNTQVQFNDDETLGGSAAFTFNKTTNAVAMGGTLTVTGNTSAGNISTGGSLSVTGNANVGNIGGGAGVFTGNVSSGNLSSTGSLSVTGNANVGNLGATAGVFTGNVSALNASLGNLATANFVNVSTNVNVTGTMQAGSVRTDNLLQANGDPWDFQQPAGSNTQIQFNNGDGNFGASANFTFNPALNNMTVTGTANVTGILYTPNLNSGTGNLTLTSGSFTTVFDNTGNVTFPANSVITAKTVVGDVISGNMNVAAPNTTILFSDSGNVTGSNSFTFNKTNNNVSLTSNLILGPNAQSQLVNLSNTSVELRGGFGAADLSRAGILAGNLANNTDWARIRVEGNVNSESTALVEANLFYVRTPGGTANILGVNTKSLNSSNTTTGALVVGGGAGITGNAYVGGVLGVTGNATANNITATNDVGAATATITGNLTSGNANLGNLATANFVQTGRINNGNSNVTLTANGNVSVGVTGVANVLVVTSTGANVLGTLSANGNADFGNVTTARVTGSSSDLTLAAAAGNNSVILAPTGTGVISASNKNIALVADPLNPQDAATKAYVDSVATGLQIHEAVRVYANTNLNATYNNGGTALTTIAITGAKTIQFSGAHGLSVNDEIYWANTFNGIIANNPYFVQTTPASDTITVRASYTGAEVTTLTNGTGLTQGAVGNPGVGATLTNAGTNAAIVVDGITLGSGNRVLVAGQTNAFENGVYTVTTVGNGSTAWVLTRATDADQYAPTDVSKLGYGDYFFVQQGGSFAGSSYVLTSPTGEIAFGITNIAFSQFAAAGSYSAGNGIAIDGTVISANVDNITTAIVGGNIVVKTSAQLTTPNIGAATGTSVSLTGNVLANNVNANTLLTAPNVQVTGNVVAANINANANITANNATINLALTGNTANFSGNVVVPNLTVNLSLVGNTGNFSGNVKAAFVQAGTGSTIANLTTPLISAVANSNGFIQAYVYNSSNGTLASSDFIAYPNNGTDETGYIDVGITSANYNSLDFAVTEENEGYVFMSAPDLSGTSGNLVLATGDTGAHNSIEFFVGGFDQVKSNRAMLIATTGVTIKGNLTAGNINGAFANGNSNVAIPSANGNVTVSVAGNANIAVFSGTGLQVNGNTRTTGVSSTGVGAVIAGVTNTLLPNTVASFSANSNSYVQLTLQNKSNLSDATVDFIATADNGNDDVNYIDMGIINSGYDNQTPTNSLGNIVFGGDGYLYAQGNASNTSANGGNLAIGTSTAGKTVKIFAGGVNTSAIVATISNTGLAVTGVTTVSGNANVGNLGTAGLITATGNITGGNLVTGGAVSATGNVSGGNLTTGGALSVTGNANVGNIGASTGVFTTAVTTANLTANGTANLGAIANVKISGGTSGQVIQTDGSGNLSFVSINSAGISNGTSNVSIATSGGNVTTSVGGVANVLVVTSTGANVAGTANITGAVVVGGNLTAGNTTVNGTLISGNIFANTSTIQGNVVNARDYLSAGSTGVAKITGTTVTTNTTSSGQTIASVIRGSDAMGVRFTVVSNDGNNKSQLQYVDVISMGDSIDHTVTGPAPLGGTTGTLNVSWSSSNSTILLTCTPASSNTTTWSTTINWM